MRNVVTHKYATSILYDHMAHGADLIQAVGLKKLFDFYSLKNRIDSMFLQEIMANRHWTPSFPDMQQALNLLNNSKVYAFKELDPSKLTNEIYVSTIKNMVNACLEHEKKTKEILHQAAEAVELENFDVVERLSQDSDELCEVLMQMITRYNKYGWEPPYIEDDQERMYDHYMGRMKHRM